MRRRALALAAPIALALGVAVATMGAPSAAEWSGDAQHAQRLIQAKYAGSGIKSPDVVDTGKTFTAGGVVWRVYEVRYDGTGFRHVAVTRQKNGEYLAIEGVDSEKKWSRGVPIGR